MLSSKRNTDDGDAEQQAKEKVRECYPYSSADDPKDIHERIQASCTGGCMGNDGAKGSQRGYGELEQLDTEGNTDNREAKYEATNEVLQKNEEAAEDNPDKVT